MLTYHQRSIATFTLCLLLAACSVPQPNVEQTPTRIASATAEAQATQALPQATLTTAPSTSTATPLPTATALPATATPKPTAIKLPSATPSSVASIISFTVTPTVVIPGDSVTLSWKAIGERVVICPPTELSNLPNLQLLVNDNSGAYYCFDVPLAGSWKVAIDPPGSYHFRLEVNTGQVWSTRDVYICSGKADWFFDYADAPIFIGDKPKPNWCPIEPPLNSQAAAQQFEHGLMIWIEARNEFFIFFDDHHVDWFGPDLKPDASINHRVGNVPAGLYEPVSGFGLIWRGEIVGTEGIREQLGWAQQPEFGFGTTYQCAMATDDYTLRDCYLRGPQKILHFTLRQIVDASFEVKEDVASWEELESP